MENWFIAVSPEITTFSPIITCPAIVVLFDKTVLFPMEQSCATWEYARILQLLPIVVIPNSAVPLFIVTYSLIVVLSPITTYDSSPLYF